MNPGVFICEVCERFLFYLASKEEMCAIFGCDFFGEKTVLMQFYLCTHLFILSNDEKK